jgi:hypothetical protein
MSLPIMNPSYTGTTVAFLIVFYLLLVRTHRWRRYRAVHDKYTPKYLARTLTPVEAQQVVRLAFAWDMPTLSQYALYVALFEASAIVRAACWSLIWSLDSVEEHSPRYLSSSLRRSSSPRGGMPTCVGLLSPDVSLICTSPPQTELLIGALNGVLHSIV